MARIWIIERGQIVFIGKMETKNQTERENKIEMHKVIIKALKSKGEK